ncbi:MAG TPA: winged helix DNA-binding domain-containing protein [Actinomycetales bacterium]|nr:winged helix DNA-binding domain-containing protein [Actinomycetales bacterium]
MTISTAALLRMRLQSQGLVRPVALGGPEQVVERLFALQGQDLAGVQWSLGLRSGVRRSEVRAAFASGALVRTWPFRGTLHVMAGRDVAWVLELTGRRTLTSAAKRHRDLGLDDGTVETARAVAVDSLAGGRSLSRQELFQTLDEHGVSTESQRGAHLLWSLCLSGTCVLGPFDGDAQRIVLLDEWVPQPRTLTREQALVEVVARYLAGHGPATEADLAWFTKLPLRDLRAGIDGCRDELTSFSLGGATYLAHAPTLDAVADQRPSAVLALPGFDELLLGYADRSASLPPQHAPRTVPGNNGLFKATVVSRGRVLGLWSRRSTATKTVVTVTPFDGAFPSDVVSGLLRVVHAYGTYLGHPTELLIGAGEPSTRAAGR